MQVFLIFFLFTICCARPDVGLGYNYEENSGNDGIGGINENFAPQQPAIVNKQFYVHSAPEDRDSGRVKHFRLGRPQKNYRVVFIKAPASEQVRLAAEYAPSEEKTAIYVLSQKEHELNANDIVTPAPTQPSKPEVFFIKYKTPEEAEHAQKQIQAQYDTLGGSSQFSDEGTAPISSVIGALKNFGLQTSGSSQVGVTSGYLPPNKKNYLPPRRY